MKRKKRMTSWERRRHRRTKIMIRVMIFAFFMIAAILFARMLLPYEKLSLNEYFTVSYDGYNTKGFTVFKRDDEALMQTMAEVLKKHDSSLFHKEEVTEEDYRNFIDSIRVVNENQSNLSNGSRISVKYTCDEMLAKKLKISVTGKSKDITVEGLSSAVVLTKEDLFRDLQVTFSGISPNITMEITNNSSNEFIKNMVFNPEEFKEYYTAGEVVRIRAFFSDAECLKQHYAITTPSEQCVMEYTVEGMGEYVNSASVLPDNFIKEAVAAGKTAFVDANEYGVRIFCEAHLVPVYINKKATFRYLEPSLISAYFKAVKPEYAGKDGNDYNDLDLVYFVKITQADGVTCDAEAVVRFSNIIQNKDGTFTSDFSNPKIMSASYSDSSIKKNVISRYETTHVIEKLAYSEYY